MPNEFEKLTERVIRLENELAKLNRLERFTFEKPIQMLDGRNIQTGKTTGTIICTETAQKLGFFNTTPVIQQTTSSQSPASFSAGTSGIVNDSATWGGYTVGDIVAILQAFGFIA